MSLGLAPTRLFIALLTALLVAAFALSPVAARPATASSHDVLTQPITGTFTDALGGTGTFDGTFTVERFTGRGGTLNAVGTLAGTLTDSLGNVIGTVEQQVSLPVGAAQASCEILELTLGPLDLNLLGLEVHLDEVHLLIEAVPGPGNLLGNLLCAIAGLLDGGLNLNVLTGLLNAIVNLLNNLNL